MEEQNSTTYQTKSEKEFQCEDDILVQSANPQSQENIHIDKLYINQEKNPVKNYHQSSLGKYHKESITDANFIYRLQILSLLILLTLCILIISNYDSLLQLEVLRNEHIISSYDNSLQDTMKFRYQFCPDPDNTFHVNCNDDPLSVGPIPTQLIRQAQFCRLPILDNSHLEDLANRWNIKFPDQKIKIEDINDKDRKQLLLALLKLYFSGGTYVSATIPYSEIEQRAWRYTLTGYEVVFIDYLYKNEKGIYVPDSKKFMKAKYPYSPQVKGMIDRFLNQQDIMEECQHRQCLIVKAVA